MNSFMSWLGGKKALRDAVLARFPPYYERYIEVFGGAGWVLFHKPPGMDFEVYNDFNGNLANLYRCVRDNPNKLKYSFVMSSILVKISTGLLVFISEVCSADFVMLTGRRSFISLSVTATQVDLTASAVSRIQYGRISR